MFDRVTALEIIDRAYDEQRWCASCGAPTVLRNDGDAVILECSELGGTGILDRIGDFLLPHTQHVVIDFAREVAA